MANNMIKTFLIIVYLSHSFVITTKPKSRTFSSKKNSTKSQKQLIDMNSSRPFSKNSFSNTYNYKQSKNLDKSILNTYSIHNNHSSITKVGQNLITDNHIFTMLENIKTDPNFVNWIPHSVLSGYYNKIMQIIYAKLTRVDIKDSLAHSTTLIELGHLLIAMHNLIKSLEPSYLASINTDVYYYDVDAYLGLMDSLKMIVDSPWDSNSEYSQLKFWVNNLIEILCNYYNGLIKFNVLISISKMYYFIN